MTKQHRIDALVECHLALVESIAKRVLRRVQFDRRVELDDLRSAGYIGLVQAAQRFEDGAVPFAAFAARRIYGAIVDDFRQTAPLSRGHWRAVLDGLVTFHEEPLTDFIAGNTSDPAPSPERLAIAADRTMRVTAAVAALPYRERRVLERFDRDETQADLAAIFGVGESRVAQIEASAIKRLRAVLWPSGAKKPAVPVRFAEARRARTWANDPERRAKAVETGRLGYLAWRGVRRPRGGFGAHRVA